MGSTKDQGRTTAGVSRKQLLRWVKCPWCGKLWQIPLTNEPLPSYLVEMGFHYGDRTRRWHAVCLKAAYPDWFYEESDKK